MWAIGQFANLADFRTAATRLGFAHIELNHAVNSAMLAGLLSRPEIVPGTIASVHEPCPADISAPTLKERNWLVSSPDEDCRCHGVAAVRRSIDLAHHVGAGVVVVHPGKVDIDPALEYTLLDLYKAGQADQPHFARARERLVAARQAQAPVNLRAVRRSLLELAEYAAHLGLRLGLENRFHYYEIPQPDELDDLLGLDAGGVIGYWHDIGHAQVLQHLGFAGQDHWLSRFAGRIVGVHLHDVVGIDDHRAAGLGCINWDLVARHLPPAALRTCEFQPSNTPAQVAAALEFMALAAGAAARPIITRLPAASL